MSDSGLTASNIYAFSPWQAPKTYFTTEQTRLAYDYFQRRKSFELDLAAWSPGWHELGVNGALCSWSPTQPGLQGWQK